MYDPMNWSTPGFSVHHYLLEFAQTHVHWVSDAIQPSHSLSPPSPSALNFSQLWGPFQWVGSSQKGCPKYLSFSINVSISNEYSGLISTRIDWFDLLAFQGSLTSLLQHHNLKVPILQHSLFFMVKLSHPYMTTGKTSFDFHGWICQIVILWSKTVQNLWEIIKKTVQWREDHQKKKIKKLLSNITKIDSSEAIRIG